MERLHILDSSIISLFSNLMNPKTEIKSNLKYNVNTSHTAATFLTGGLTFQKQYNALLIMSALHHRDYTCLTFIGQ